MLASAPPWLGRYLRDVREVILRPTDFFRGLKVSDGLSYPLAFALVNHWLGSATSFLWHGLLNHSAGRFLGPLFSVFEDVVEIENPAHAVRWQQLKDQFLHWVWGVGSVLIDPFTTLVYILFLSTLVYAGARLFVTPGRNGAPDQIRFESAASLVCFGMTPTLFNLVPLMGSGIASMLTLILTIIGAKEIYRVDWLRALGIGLFPLVLFGMMIFGALGTVAVLIFRLFAPG